MKTNRNPGTQTRIRRQERRDPATAKPGQIWSHVRRKWLVETPEESVRQEYLLVLLHEYGYDLDQIAEEAEVTGRGAAHARADFVVWRSAPDKAGQKPPFIIVECKSDNVTIRREDYAQGDHYARLTNAPFFVTHNHTETRFWRVRKDRMPVCKLEISGRLARIRWPRGAD